ncbi:MAG: dimethylsulfonioproprionate lyase family protein [Pseudomonadota bacterium]
MDTPEAIEHALRGLVADLLEVVGSGADMRNGQRVAVPDARASVYVGEPSRDRPCAYRFVDEILARSLGGPVEHLVHRFKMLEDHLIWGHAPGYDADTVGEDFLDNYCHALLTGPDGPLRCDAPLGAFVLFGPHTFYREHHHAPNEVYLALSGGGQWQVEGAAWQILEAGQTIFIPSGAVHAIRAGEEPLLTFSFWLEPGDMLEIAI